ncbi:MAG TPA: F0F1 ATP synthase subunit gamma [Rhodanobacteraceae bacterium]
MAGAREIRTKIKSVANTRKVTRALEMVSASKIRRAQDLMRASRPYAKHMRRVIAHIAQATTDFRHPALRERPVKRVCYVVVSTDRGLCGGLNANLFRKLLGEIREWEDKGVEVDVVAIGQKAAAFFRRIKVNLIASVSHLGDHPKLEKLIGVNKVVDDAFMQGRVDRVYLCYNDFVNTMAQRPNIDVLVPLPAAAKQMEAMPQDDAHPSHQVAILKREHSWDYLYEPDAETVIRHLLGRYVESLVYHAVLENLASEHAARMVAMKSASDNATKAIDTLTLIYNKARQAAITQEISEIVGGAAAV